MADIKMCDFCGVISTQMAAAIFIRPYPVGSNQYLNEHLATNDQIKDACSDCLDKFNQPRNIKILEAKANGDL